MKRIIREYTPFIILAYSIVFTVLSYFDCIYDPLYNYLSQLLGFSVFTNLFMYSVYMNKMYCTSTKVCVLGLIVLNVFNVFYIALDINGVVYDMYIVLILLAVLALMKCNIKNRI